MGLENFKLLYLHFHYASDLKFCTHSYQQLCMSHNKFKGLQSLQNVAHTLQLYKWVREWYMSNNSGYFVLETYSFCPLF